jgi:Immunity protein 7
MLEAHGWIVVRTSRDCYIGVDITEVDELDYQVDQADAKLWTQLHDWLGKNESPWFKWQFFEHLNNAPGVLQFFVSRNHRASRMWDLLEWIAKNGTGSYGLVYVHDDEDLIGVNGYGRGSNDYSNEFRVWRILRGTVEELDDPFLSPIVPRVNPSEYA